MLRHAMPQPARHQSCSTWPSEQSSGPPGFRWMTSPFTAKAQPRVCDASDDNVRQSNRASSFGCFGVPWRFRYSGVATHRRRLSARRTETSDESARSPTRTAQS